ncbi:hypothetical protein [Streptomyces antimycoticus]|uniref:hypothetical protein n=1 Tax=Streptomyces antimycoticus TaxID=68175 RepID=UPI0010F62A71|nr:hypothetical protein [Streptomyces antimycoticus]
MYFGSFDAEQHGHPGDLATLPQLPDPIADRLVACMDEALVTAAAPDDLLVTRRPVSEVHRRALEAAGFGCVYRHAGGPDSTADVEHQLLEDPELLSERGEFRRIYGLSSSVTIYWNRSFALGFGVSASMSTIAASVWRIVCRNWLRIASLSCVRSSPNTQ